MEMLFKKDYPKTRGYTFKFPGFRGKCIHFFTSPREPAWIWFGYDESSSIISTFPRRSKRENVASPRIKSIYPFCQLTHPFGSRLGTYTHIYVCTNVCIYMKSLDATSDADTRLIYAALSLSLLPSDEKSLCLLTLRELCPPVSFSLWR